MQSAEISSNFGQNLPALVSVSASTFVWAPYLPHRLVVLFVSKQVHVDVGADGGWPLEVDVILPETLQGVERPRLANNRKEIRASERPSNLKKAVMVGQDATARCSKPNPHLSLLLLLR